MKIIIYCLWLLGLIIWNFGFPSAKPIYDVLIAVGLKYAFDSLNNFI